MATRAKPPTAAHRHGEPLGETRAALTAIGQDLRTGSRDLYGDVETLVRSARRDTSKLGTALRGDVGRLLKAAPRLRMPTKPATKRASHVPRRRTAEPRVKKTAA